MAVPARFLDRYTLERVLAERGAVTTRLMRDGDGALVVVKTLSMRRSTDVRDIELFERETGVLRHLHHPSIPRLVDAGVDDDGQGDVQLHLVQSHVPGKTLEGWITDGRSFTAAEATRIGRDLADVLTTIHGTSPPLVHRDIKPSNVVLDDDGRVFLIDFGAAKRAARDGTAIGTFGYMAPEQLEGRASPRSDVFGVGMTLIHLLTHLHPEAFADDGGVRKAWRARANVPDGLGELLSSCVALDDEQRPADGAALRDRFDALLRPGSVAVTRSTMASPTSTSPGGVGGVHRRWPGGHGPAAVGGGHGVLAYGSREPGGGGPAANAGAAMDTDAVAVDTVDPAVAAGNSGVRAAGGTGHHRGHRLFEPRRAGPAV